MTSCPAILGKKSAKCLQASRLCTFEVKHNPLTPKDVKLRALQSGHLGFLIFFDFDPQNSEVWFKKINAYKIIFWSYPKNRNTCCKPTYKKHTYEISKQYLYNWLCNGKKKKQRKVIASLFEMLFLAFLFTVHKNKSFLESWDKTGQDRLVFRRKFWFKKFDLFWPNLTLYWPFLGWNPKINATIVFCVPNDS